MMCQWPSEATSPPPDLAWPLSHHNVHCFAHADYLWREKGDCKQSNWVVKTEKYASGINEWSKIEYVELHTLVCSLTANGNLSRVTIQVSQNISMYIFPKVISPPGLSHLFKKVEEQEEPIVVVFLSLLHLVVVVVIVIIGSGGHCCYIVADVIVLVDGSCCCCCCWSLLLFSMSFSYRDCWGCCWYCSCFGCLRILVVDNDVVMLLL